MAASLPPATLKVNGARYVTTTTVTGRTVPVEDPTIRLILHTVPGGAARHADLTTAQALALIQDLADAVAKAVR